MRHSFRPRRNRHFLSKGIPPPDLIREDFHRMSNTIRLRTSQLVEEMILMQSIEGHAHEGHGAFSGRRFINTTIQDAVLALGLDPVTITEQRQELIDEVGDWLKSAADGKSPNLLMTAEGECLLDIGLFRQIEVEPKGVLQGFYLGGLRDNSAVRVGVEKKYGVRIGGGECALVDMAVLEASGLNAEQLAHGEWQNQMAEFRAQGLITEYRENDPRRLRYLYIRHRQGGGTSDDAAILAVGKLFGPSAALGAFLADAVDTFEKYVPLPRYADQDDDLALWIKDNVSDLGATEEDLQRVTYLCAVPGDQHDAVPDSSLRWMLSIDRGVDQTALESHLAYLQGRPYAPMLLAFERVANQELYDWFAQRLVDDDKK
jgi:hypothetical protein